MTVLDPISLTDILRETWDKLPAFVIGVVFGWMYRKLYEDNR